jgi:hypothetical protein
VSDGEQLLDRVQALRRRLLGRAALEGAARGALTGLAGAEAVTLLARLVEAQRSAAAWGQVSTFLGALLVGALAGAGLAGWRHRLSVEGAARLFDRHLGGTGDAGTERGNADRVRVAVSLAPIAGDSRFAAAAVADGWRTLARVPPSAVAPARWPAGGVALVAVVLLAGPLHLWSRPGGRAVGAAPGIPGGAGEPSPARDRAALIAEGQRVAQTLRDMARTLGDEPLRALAARLAQTLETVPMQDVETAALKELVGAARAAADQARLATVGARAGGGQAMRRGDAAGEKGGPPSASAGDPRPEPGRRLGGMEEPRPAASKGQATPPPGTSPTPEPSRQLERLGRDLDPPAAAGNTPAGPAASGAGAGPPAAGPARERLARAEEQLRRSLGDARSGKGPDRAAAGSGSGAAPAAALTDFERRARGGGDPGGAASGQKGEQDGERAPSAAAGGEGPGGSADAGGGRRGRRTPGAEAREPGQALETALDEGPGPSRAESIALGAGAGFADRGYHRTYRAYRAAVEQTLELTAVPDGRQQLVKRYFDLIRPRGR